MKKILSNFLFAIGFLTRFPVPKSINFVEISPAKSFRYYPLVGIIMGIFLVAFYSVFNPFLSAGSINSLLIIVHVYLSGALHLDGFMDTVDGIFSGREKKQILEIMHDSNVGSFGVVALILLFLLKFNLLQGLTATIKIPSLILMPAVSRWMIVFSAFRYPLASSSSLGKKFTEDLGWKELFIGCIWMIALFIILHYFFFFSVFKGLLVFFLSLILSIYISRFIVKRIDGLTGDSYGAINEIIEVFVLLIVNLYSMKL
jgi:adenosylcobinamide-GDP ribazoletransferase